MSLHRLLPLFERARSLEQPLVLATVIRTGGSTYAKPGAQMLIAADGEYAGLLSGGCLEGDLREYARDVAATGAARIVSYDLRSSTDQLFGLGAGCEGAMDILLARVSDADGWQPLPCLAGAFRRGEGCRLAFVVASREPGIEPGLSFPADGDLPVDMSGGVLSTNPIGASGMIRFAEAALQVRGLAGEHQVDGARRVLGHAYGGGSQFFAMWLVGAEPPAS